MVNNSVSENIIVSDEDPATCFGPRTPGRSSPRDDKYYTGGASTSEVIISLPLFMVERYRNGIAIRYDEVSNNKSRYISPFFICTFCFCIFLHFFICEFAVILCQYDTVH